MLPVSMPGDEPTGLFTDLYEFTMAQSYLEHGITGEATFDLHVRSLPAGRGYLVAGGIVEALERLERFTFDGPMCRFLTEQGLSDQLVDELASLELDLDVRAIPEGRLVFPYEPFLQVTGSLPAAQLVETLLLNAVHVGTVMATKAARCLHAARAHGERTPALVDFGARRAHGPDAANLAARAAYLGGFAGTSLVEAARTYAIPCFGTMAHSYVQAFEDERAALESFASSFPQGTTLLIDTFDTIQGAQKAIDVAHELASMGGELGGVRLDSGDLAGLAKQVRRLLDEEGLTEVDIFASSGLDEYEIRDLLEAGAPIDGMGVGTNLVVSSDAPSVDLSYKLVEYEGQPVTKLSPGKEVLPGRKQVHRTRGEDDRLAGDVIATPAESVDGEPLLEAVGSVPEPTEALEAARERFLAEFARLPDRFKALEAPEVYPVERSPGIEAARDQAIDRAQTGR